MHPSRGGRPYTHQDPDIYDDRPSSHLPGDTYRGSSPPNSYQDSRKDTSRTSHRGQDDRMDSNFQQRDHRPSYSEDYERYRRHDDGSRSPRREGRRRYNDRDREGYRSPKHGRSRSRSRSPYYGAPPSRTVILEGLAMNMTQEDVLNELQDMKVQNLEEVRVIRDKKTGVSRQFAFAQFKAIENARAFLDRFHPTIHLYGPYDSTRIGDAEYVKVRISYSREKEDREQAGKNDDDWRCDVCHLANYSHRLLCFRCNGPKTRATAAGVVGVVSQASLSTFSGFVTTGDSDVSLDNTASQFLLFRGLEPGVTEELLAKAVKKLYKGATAPDAQAPKKVKITSTSAEANFGAREGSLRRVLLVRDRRSNDSWRYGFAEFASVDDAQAAMAKYNASEKFTISSKPVLVSYIHAGVFVPVLQAPSEEVTKFTFSPLSNPAANLMYWDESAYASEMACHQEELSPLAKAKESLQVKLAAAAAAGDGLLGVIKDGDGKSKKRKAEKDTASSTKKVVAPHLQFWSNRHAELHGLPPKEFDDPEEETSQSVIGTKSTEAADDVPPRQSFADMNRKCCLLCSRQFKTEIEVIKHERVSQLHRDNMLNEELKSKALAKLAKALKSQTDAEGSAYRDRAKERRQAFNQPKQPAAQHSKAAKESPVSVATKEDEGPPPPSKGAALLGKMGWTAGEGLGAQGTGRTETISTDLYAQGVGLGAQGGKVGDAIEEADRSTRGSYADFVMKAKDKAKERFESMG